MTLGKPVTAQHADRYLIRQLHSTECHLVSKVSSINSHYHTHTHLTALFLGLPGWAGTRKVKPIWILPKQETVSGSGISWAICTYTLLQTDNHASASPLLVWWQEGHPACKKTEWWGVGVVICLERGADLHMAQLMPLPLIVSCFSKIQIGFYLSGTGSPGWSRKKGR